MSEFAEIATALISVPRHHFIPSQAWAVPTGPGDGRWIDRHKAPDSWWEAVYSDTVIITQLDGGRVEMTPEHAAGWRWPPTCSASGPSLVAAFLARLGVRPGDRVLEVGTGTGYTAGLLTHLAGRDGHVTTVEIDPALAAGARASLSACGLHPEVVTADAATGLPVPGQYDRIHVTAGISDRIPSTWIDRARPGTVIVLPHNGLGRLVRLTVGEDGGATGTLHDPCGFMPLRGHTPAKRGASDPGPARSRPLTEDPARLADPPDGLQVLFDALLGECPWDDGEGTIRISCDGSAAKVRDGRVTQRGPRNLWDEAEHLARRWERHGRPGLDRLGLTVTGEDQYLWLDSPQTPASTVLNSGE